MIAYLRTVMRLPLREVRDVVQDLHGIQISLGELVELLHRIKEVAHPLLSGLKSEILASPAVQADETGWREDGQNGYIWSVSTLIIRYYEYHHSRGGEVVKQLIGNEFQGVLGSDFYAAYNVHQGLHQRCWVHLLRDIHELKDDFPDDQDLRQWATQVKNLYEQAMSWTAQGSDSSLSPRRQEQLRKTQQHTFEQALWALCQPYVGTSTPQRTLCERVERFLPELFVFVAVPGVPAHNISLSAVCARWLLLAKSAEEPVVPKAVPLAWDWPPSSAPGWPSISILFSNVWPFSLPHPPWVNSEQFQRVLTLDYSTETEVY